MRTIEEVENEYAWEQQQEKQYGNDKNTIYETNRPNCIGYAECALEHHCWEVE